jgi:hypothetical protein
VKLATRPTCLGDRLSFPDVIDGRLVDVQAAYARMLETRGSHRDDAIPRSRREIADTLPELLQADPDLAVVRAVHQWASAAAGTGDLTEDCTWSAEPELHGRETAMAAVAGYVAFVDIGARDVAELDNHRMDRGKGFDTFGIVGPWFVTKDEIPDPHALGIRFWVNGELRQDGSSSELFHHIPEQLSWLTEALTLAPGDIVSTGTRPGVSRVHPGDELRGEIDGLGVHENAVVLDPSGQPRVAAAIGAAG